MTIIKNPNIRLGSSESYKDKAGRSICKSLFVESYTKGEWEQREFQPYFTLADKDIERYGITFTSLYAIYISMSDPTEYEFAMAVFGSYDHWNLLCKSKWFNKYVQSWRTDLRAKLKSEAITTLKDIATNEKTPPSVALSAVRTFLKEEWLDETAKTRRGGTITRKVTKEDAEQKLNEWTPSPTLDDIKRTKH